MTKYQTDIKRTAAEMKVVMDVLHGIPVKWLNTLEGKLCFERMGKDLKSLEASRHKTELYTTSLSRNDGGNPIHRYH